MNLLESSGVLLAVRLRDGVEAFFTDKEASGSCLTWFLFEDDEPFEVSLLVFSSGGDLFLFGEDFSLRTFSVKSVSSDFTSILTVASFSTSIMDDSSTKSSSSSPRKSSTSFLFNDRLALDRSMRLMGWEPKTDEMSTGFPRSDFSGDLVFLSFLGFGLIAILGGSSSSSLEMTNALALRFGGADDEEVGEEATVVDDGFLVTEKKERISCNFWYGLIRCLLELCPTECSYYLPSSFDSYNCLSIKITSSGTTANVLRNKLFLTR